MEVIACRKNLGHTKPDMWSCFTDRVRKCKIRQHAPPPPKAIHTPCVRNVYMTPQPQSHIDRYCVALAMYASALPPNQPHGMSGVIGIIRLTGEPCVCRVSGHAADPVMSVGHLAMASSKNNYTNTNEYICVHRHQLVCFAAAMKGWRRDPIPSLLSQKWTLRP